MQSEEIVSDTGQDVTSSKCGIDLQENFAVAFPDSCYLAVR